MVLICVLNCPYIEFIIHQCTYTESGYDRKCGVLDQWTAVLISGFASRFASRQSPRLGLVFVSVSHPVDVLGSVSELPSEF